MKFIRGTVADGSVVVPISAQLKFNIGMRGPFDYSFKMQMADPVACIDAINEALIGQIPVPPRDFTASPQMMV